MRFPVSTEKEVALNNRLLRLGVTEQSLVEKFTHASGPGGQNVNKTSTAVHLKHVPTGIVVRAQEARSLGLNRYAARKRLAERLEAQLRGERTAKEAEAFKRRKQKRRRSRRAKEKVLANKHQQAEKKAQRGFTPED